MRSPTPARLACTLCLWFGMETTADYRGRAPNQQWHNLCRDHLHAHEGSYTGVHRLTPPVVDAILAGRNPYSGGTTR